MTHAPYRLIQWATGWVGREALKAILMHPGLELAGVLVHSKDKDEVDAGDLCSEAATVSGADCSPGAGRATWTCR